VRDDPIFSWGDRIMRNAPMRWIEQAERRQVVTQALLDAAPQQPRSTTRIGRAAQWLPRIGAWLAAHHPPGWPPAQLQPALVRQRIRRALRSDCW